MTVGAGVDGAGVAVVGARGVGCVGAAVVWFWICVQGEAVGARGVLLTVVKDRPLEGHIPDAVCANYADLPAILAGME